jgi:hypothetical protein
MDFYPRGDRDCRRRCHAVLDPTGLASDSQLARTLGATIPHQPPRSGLRHQRRQSPDGREVPVEIHHRGFVRLENLVGGYSLLGKLHSLVWVYILRPYNHLQPGLHQHRSAALDCPHIRRWCDVDRSLLLAIRQTPDTLAVHPDPFLHRSLRVHRTPGDPPSEISRSHLWDSLRYPRGCLSPNHRHPKLGRQHPLAHLEAFGGNGESSLHFKI